MARFEIELPLEVIKEFETVYNNTEQIFGAMTKAGADVVLSNVKANVPQSFKGSNIMKCLKITRTYRTPSDDGINNKVGFYGYFVNHDGKTEPAPLVVNVFEYGSSKFAKRPFFRKAFRKEQIERAMMEAQIRASRGLLTDE